MDAQAISLIFCESLSESLRAQASTWPALQEELERYWSQAREAWPALELEPQVFFADLAHRLSRNPPRGSLADWFPKASPADLYLAAACSMGLSGALPAFERHYGNEIAGLLGRYQGPKMPREDLLQILREKLFVAPGPGRAAKIGDYAGQGSLKNWLWVTGSRVFIDVLRSTSSKHKETPSFEDDQLLDLPDPDIDPELAFLKREYRARFKEAFAIAARQLTSRERNLLRQHLVAGLTVDQIGRIHGVHRATAARHVAAAREQLLTNTKEELQNALSITTDELDSIIELIRSRIELSLNNLLRTVTEPPHEP